MQSVFQEKYNNCVVTALLYSHLPLCEKERKIQQFVNDSERYDIFCDNVYSLILNKDNNDGVDTLYITTEGFSFVSNSLMLPQESCFPVLTMNRVVLDSVGDISKIIEIALFNFSAYCDLMKAC